VVEVPTPLIVYASVSPFYRRVAEYYYGGVSVESQYPVAPLLEHDPSALAVVLVEDMYSVWPQVSAMPGSETYEELVSALEDYMRRTCAQRMPPHLCNRTVFRVVPSLGEMGAWRFTGGTGDTLLFTVHHVLSVLLAWKQRPKPRQVYVVIDPEANTTTQLVVLEASYYIAELLQAKHTVVYAPPYPKPQPRKPPLQELYEYNTPPLLPPLRTICRVERANILEPRPGAKKIKLSQSDIENIKLTMASACFASQCQLLPLLYQACGSRNPIEKIAKILTVLANTYTTNTKLSKKKIGGTIYHTYTVNTEALRRLLIGATIEATILNTIKESKLDCDNLYKNGAPTSLLHNLSRKLGCPCDTTPQNCITKTEDHRLLRKGCLKQLREQLESNQTKTRRPNK
jgi:hypothetical protein